MRGGDRFASASGLRPMSAFVVVAIVVLAVAGRVAALAIGQDTPRPDRTVRETGSAPEFVLQDRDGQTLALSVPRFDLEMSPRSMWQAHTPRRIAQKLSSVLGGAPTEDELLAAMLPGTDALGRILVEDWPLTPRQAFFAREWIATGAETGGAPLSGFELVAGPAHEGRPRELLRWEPAGVLSRATRESYGFTSPWRWARHLAVSLDRCVTLPLDREAIEARRTLLHEEVWRGLVPRGHCVPVQGIDSSLVLDVRALLREEGVSPWQLRIQYASDRVHPCGEHPLVGTWGYLRPTDTAPVPRDGLERLASNLLASDEASFLELSGARYTWRRDRSVRGERANEFLGYAAGSPPPVVHSTLDLSLMRRVQAALDGAMAEHRPALAEAIVIDVETGDVLAVDSREAYEVQPFSPVFYTFTPGSTFKVVTMAVALEEGAIRPETRFDVGPRDHWVLVDPATGRKRVIHEAEGALAGEISAAEALAWSVNAGLVQIGLRVPADVLRGYLARLGYGAAPGAGLGSERAGHLRELPWAYRGTHASVSFGHELTTSLWQHATALAAVARGGVQRPLRLLSGIEQGPREHALAVPAGERVFSARTSAEVRAMMALGAREGTGRHAGAALLELAAAAGWDLTLADLALGTKTGTAQKVSTEMCVHIELAERQRTGSISSARYRELKGAAKPHRACYTSSMCAVARRPSDGRELMVLVVVDEPRGEAKFGSEVAGPAAVEILAEALGFTREGRTPSREVVAGFGATELPFANDRDEPWRGERD